MAVSCCLFNQVHDAPEDTDMPLHEKEKILWRDDDRLPTGCLPVMRLFRDLVPKMIVYIAVVLTNSTR